MGLQGLISRCGSSRRGVRFRTRAAVESMSKEEVEKSSQWRSQRSFARTGKACESRGGTLDCQASNSVLVQELQQASDFRDGELWRSMAYPAPTPFGHCPEPKSLPALRDGACNQPPGSPPVLGAEAASRPEDLRSAKRPIAITPASLPSAAKRKSLPGRM